MECIEKTITVVTVSLLWLFCPLHSLLGLCLLIHISVILLNPQHARTALQFHRVSIIHHQQETKRKILSALLKASNLLSFQQEKKQHQPTNQTNKSVESLGEILSMVKVTAAPLTTNQGI